MKVTEAKIEPSVNFHWNEKQSYPKEIHELELGANVTVTVTGKVKSLSDEWGHSFVISMGKVEIVPQKEKPKGVGEAMELMKGQRRV